MVNLFFDGSSPITNYQINPDNSLFYIDNARILERNPADLNDDDVLDMNDLSMFVSYWLSDDYDADMFKDGIVDLLDWVMFNEYWGK